MKTQTPLTDEIFDKKFAKITKDNQLRLVLETLNYNGVLYTLTINSTVKSKSQCYDKPAS